ncbi:MAG: hypothetical protein L3J32_04285 [Rhizobiaceae bacterium]|nr:hypothetical protein [Rhizobiaceae bacterium]
MRLISLLAIILFAGTIYPWEYARAQQAGAIWKIEQTDPSSLPKEIVADTRALAIDGIPDGRIATGGDGATIRQAWYSRPTKRLTHGILGDAIEGGSLVVITQRGIKLKYRLPESDVFEDLTPRLVDLDGDGKTEIITIQTSLFAGAALVIYQVNGNALVRAARNGYIGQPNRWLNVAGIEYYTGNRTPEIAIVVTPHIGGRLDLYKFTGGRLVRLFSEQGFSNHLIGATEQRLSASFLASGGKSVNLALPSDSRKNLRIMSVDASGWQQIGNVALPSPIDKAIGVEGSGDNVRFTVGLVDGSVYSVFQQQ